MSVKDKKQCHFLGLIFNSLVFKKYIFLFLGINDIGANMLWPVDDFDNSRVHGRRWT